MTETREQILADTQKLLKVLADDERIPFDRYTVRLSHHVRAADDEAGMAELARIAEVLGAKVEANEDGSHHTATLTVGAVQYEATYITRQSMAEYAAFMKPYYERDPKPTADPGPTAVPEFELSPLRDDNASAPAGA